MKLIWGSDGVHELYDLFRDPDESQDLIDEPDHAGTRDALLLRLSSFVDRHGGSTPIPKWSPDAESEAGATADEQQLDPETIRQLKELGYL